MTICLVTDRARRAPVEQAVEAVQAGIDLIHVREGGLQTSELAAMVTQVVRVTRTSQTRVVVNDRLDVALACGADGVHLRGDSVAASRLRAIVPSGFLIGQSVHSLDEAVAAAPHVDYIVAGTVFPTSSKPGRTDLLGLSGLAAIARRVSVPVLAIGGMDPSRVKDVFAAGAAGVAAITLFTDRDRPITDVVRALRAQFGP
jgi:thiamine-phosphate pyrophosphorylase